MVIDIWVIIYFNYVNLIINFFKIYIVEFVINQVCGFDCYIDYMFWYLFEIECFKVICGYVVVVMVLVNLLVVMVYYVFISKNCLMVYYFDMLVKVGWYKGLC